MYRRYLPCWIGHCGALSIFVISKILFLPLNRLTFVELRLTVSYRVHDVRHLLIGSYSRRHFSPSSQYSIAFLAISIVYHLVCHLSFPALLWRKKNNRKTWKKWVNGNANAKIYGEEKLSCASYQFDFMDSFKVMPINWDESKKKSAIIIRAWHFLSLFSSLFAAFNCNCTLNWLSARMCFFWCQRMLCVMINYYWTGSWNRLRPILQVCNEQFSFNDYIFRIELGS